MDTSSDCNQQYSHRNDEAELVWVACSNTETGARFTKNPKSNLGKTCGKSQI